MLYQTSFFKQLNLVAELFNQEVIPLEVKHELIGDEALGNDEVGEVLVVQVVEIKHLSHVTENDSFELRVESCLTIKLYL